jgi:hypothetical protein
MEVKEQKNEELLEQTYEKDSCVSQSPPTPDKAFVSGMKS